LGVVTPFTNRQERSRRSTEDRRRIRLSRALLANVALQHLAADDGTVDVAGGVDTDSFGA
jgi:hypothetical protein